ncbi:F-box protein At5g07610-like [Apium graveolens]|uniref:F-box protein At5g07610-like n=1 Tax=Apium graveolens TaxID=4045 RepID=UPI003D7B27D6
MSLSKHKYIPSHYFPEQLMSEILKRLPVKDILSCGAVQKSWYSLIRTPLFISLHSNYQKLTSHINPKYLLFHNFDTHELTLRFDDPQCEEYCNHAFDLGSASAWYAQSNGLICLSLMFDSEHHYNPNIALLNPLAHKFKMLPHSPLSIFTFLETEWKALAFGFLPEVNDYVVVHIVKPKSTAAPYFDPYSPDDSYEQALHTVEIGVYSLNSNSWKKICQDKVFVDFMSTNRSVFVNGTAFWVGFNTDVSYQLVMYFDTKTNILGKIKVPNWIALHERQLCNPLILPFGQSIAYFVEVEDFDAEEDDEDYKSPHLDIWVLKDDMIDEFSWEKKMSVSISEDVWAQVLGVRNNGDPILGKLNSLITYDLDTHEPNDFVDRLTPYSYDEDTPFFFISPFVETLRLLDTDRHN